jgi:hypothetical protein
VKTFLRAGLDRSIQSRTLHLFLRIDPVDESKISIVDRPIATTYQEDTSLSTEAAYYKNISVKILLEFSS